MGEGRNDRRTTNNRLTVAQAADRLGISEDAVRSRIKRGTLRSQRSGGAVYILLDVDRPTTGEATDPPTDSPTDARDELVEELRDRIRHLEEANRENRRIIAGLIQRVPELEAAERPEDAPGDEPGGGQEAQEAPAEGSGPGEDSGGQETRSQRPWWRRLLGR